MAELRYISMVSHWLVWMGSRADLDVVTKRERERPVQPVVRSLY